MDLKRDRDATSPGSAGCQPFKDVDALVQGFERLSYVADRALATAVFLAVRLRKPLLIEGHAGLGKTEVAKVLASLLETDLIRLQCYEGLDVNSAVYEWNYQKQLLAIKIEEKSDLTVEEKERHIFSTEFLLERPLLQSILAEAASPVLLIDDIMGELDVKRRSGFLPLLHRAEQSRGQVFMTATEENWPEELGREVHKCRVVNGTLKL